MIRIAVGFCALTFILSVLFGLIYLGIVAGLMTVILSVALFLFFLLACELVGTLILDW